METDEIKLICTKSEFKPMAVNPARLLDWSDEDYILCRDSVPLKPALTPDEWERNMNADVHYAAVIEDNSVVALASSIFRRNEFADITALWVVDQPTRMRGLGKAALSRLTEYIISNNRIARFRVILKDKDNINDAEGLGYTRPS